jgi:pyruvate-formate lyase-activating enzyme
MFAVKPHRTLAWICTLDSSSCSTPCRHCANAHTMFRNLRPRRLARLTNQEFRFDNESKEEHEATISPKGFSRQIRDFNSPLFFTSI